VGSIAGNRETLDVGITSDQSSLRAHERATAATSGLAYHFLSVLEIFDCVNRVARFEGYALQMKGTGFRACGKSQHRSITERVRDSKRPNFKRLGATLVGNWNSMNSPPARLQPVSRDQSEALLTAVERRTTDPRAGIFGPASVSWKINRESAVFLGAGRAALLQLAHPWVAAALQQHSSVMSKPVARFHNTFRIVYTMIFGSLPQALTAARRLYKLHTSIQGELPESAGGWTRGAHYAANEIAALRWVFATLVESAEIASACALGPMEPAQREQYYADSKILAGLFGLPESALPGNWQAFAAYNQAMHASGELGVSSTARTMAHNLLSGAGSWIPVPRWYRALTTEWLPLRFRGEFELPLSEADQRAAEQARHRIPRIYRKLPPSIRFVGPWHQAQARLARRRPGPLTLLSNRFWIGQARLPFADANEGTKGKGQGTEGQVRPSIGDQGN
jgi:uncharacterized protein (DUF2236 family)